MNIISFVGRVLLVLVFVISGASKLIDISTTAQDVAANVVLPAIMMPYMSQLEAMTGMTTPQLLTIAAGLLELICGVMIIFNIGARWFAILLIIFTMITTYYFHDFWNPLTADRLTKLSQLGPAQVDHLNNILQAMKNLSIVGALLLIVGQERTVPSDEPVYERDIMRH